MQAINAIERDVSPGDLLRTECLLRTWQLDPVSLCREGVQSHVGGQRLQTAAGPAAIAMPLVGNDQRAFVRPVAPAAPWNLVARLRTLMSLTPDNFRVAALPCF